MLLSPTLISWQPFLSTIAEAAATLTGLVFVAVSLNLQVILAVEGRTSLASEALLQLLDPLALSLAALIPGQTLPCAGTEILLINALFWFAQTNLQVSHIRRKTGQPLSWIAKRMFRTGFSCVPFCLSGILLALGHPAGMFFLAFGCFFSLYAALANAWVLLIEILR